MRLVWALGPVGSHRHAIQWKDEVKNRLRQIAMPLALLAVWWLATEVAHVPAAFVPRPRAVVSALEVWMFGKRDPLVWWSGTWLPYVLLSTRRLIIGYAIASVVGVILGLMIAWYRVMRELFNPVIQLLRPIPMVAWFPLAILLFGIDEGASIFLVSLGALFPITIYTADGAMHTPMNLLRAALMLGSHPRSLLRKVVFPWSLPAIFSGLRVALGLAWVLVVVSEMLAVRGGIGYALWTAYQFGRMDIIVSVMITMGVLGSISDLLMVRVRDRVLRWKSGT